MVSHMMKCFLAVVLVGLLFQTNSLAEREEPQDGLESVVVKDSGVSQNQTISAETCQLKVQFVNQQYRVVLVDHGEVMLVSPAEGLWSVGSGWEGDWPPRHQHNHQPPGFHCPYPPAHHKTNSDCPRPDKASHKQDLSFADKRSAKAE